MNPSAWHRANEIFEEALDFEDERAQREFIRAACGTDEGLRVEVEELLAASRQADARGFLRADAVRTGARLLANEETRLLTGSRIGSYRVVRELGRGGMAAVYLAEREDFKQQVALKLIKRGMDTDEILLRFRREREVLAALSHPNIARLLDGGTTDDGRPFLVMELVEGKSVTDYCEEHDLSVVATLALFRKICDAVSYAHQNLVVHRDLKPSNILVDAAGEPKLLDFGIARLLGRDEAGKTVEQTSMGIAPMTPEYASPEQVRGDKITTASDVYSLGVILYELLTRTRPYGVERRSQAEMLRAVRETEPERPSSALSRAISLDVGTAEHNKWLASRTERLAKSLKGDLDNIILKALDKDPARRYGSVEHFSEDLKRHMEGLPVLARHAALPYTVGKFVRRNRTSVAFAGITLIALLAGFSVAVWQAVEAQKQRAKAEKRFEEVRRLANTLLTDLDADLKSLPGSHSASVKLARFSSTYLNGLAQDADDPALLKELARAYTRLGNEFGWQFLGNDEARASLIRAAEISRKVMAAAPTDADSKRVLADSLLTYNIVFGAEDREASLQRCAEILSLHEQILSAEPTSANMASAAFTYFYCGRDFESLGREEEARRYFSREAQLIELQIPALAPVAKTADERVTLAYKFLVLGVLKTERLGEAGEEQSRRGLEVATELARQAPDDKQAQAAIIDAHLDLGEAYRRKKDFRAALAFYRAGAKAAHDFNALSPKTWGENRRTAVYLNNALPGEWGVEREVSLLLGVAVCLHEEGERREALAKVREAFALRRAFTDNQLIGLPARGNGLRLFFSQLQTISLGVRALSLMGEDKEALTALPEAERIWKKILTEEPDAGNKFNGDLVKIYHALGDMHAGCKPDITHPEMLPNYKAGTACITAKSRPKLAESRRWYEKTVNALAHSEKELDKLHNNKSLRDAREKMSAIDQLLQPTP